MRSRKLVLPMVLCALMASVMTVTPAKAVLIVADDFNYADGNFNGTQNGGVATLPNAWTSPWTFTGDTDAGNDAWQVNAAQARTTAGGNRQNGELARNFTSSAPSGSALYFAYDMNWLNDAEGGYETTLRFLGGQVEIGLRNDALTAKVAGSTQTSASVNGLTGLRRMVGRLQFNAAGANEVLTLWVNPTSEASAALLTAQADLGALDLGSQLVFHKLGQDNNVILIDNFRLGTDFNFTPVLNSFTGIAKDSFQTTETGDGGAFYDDGTKMCCDASSTNNRMVVAGTVGFSSTKIWSGSDTGNLEPDNDGPANGGLNHVLLSGALDGALRLKAKDPRTQQRELDTTISNSSTYFMSALLQTQKVEATNVMSIGFSNANNDRDEGFHVGFSGANIAAFAGGTTFDVVPNATLGETYLVVLQLDVNAAGSDVLSAYFAPQGSLELIPAFTGQSVETFASTGDLGFLQVIINGSNVNTDDRLWWFDEVRLATTLNGLGVGVFQPVPEPATVGLLGLAGLALLRRRRAA